MDFYIPRIPFWMVEVYALAGVAAGIWRGGRDARIFVALVVYQVIRAHIFEVPTLRAIWKAPLFFYPEGLLMLTVACVAVLRGRAYWTVWAAAPLLLGFVTDMLQIFPGLTDWSYRSAQRAWFLVLISALLVGSLRSPRRHAVASMS